MEATEIGPLSQSSPSAPAPVWKVIPLAFDFIYRRRINAMLCARPVPAVRELWNRESSSSEFSAGVLKMIETEMPWPPGRLIPGDSCEMVLRGWSAAFSDCMEIERCFIGLNRLVRRQIPSTIEVRGRTLGQFVEQLYALSLLPEERPCVAAPRLLPTVLRPAALGTAGGALFGLLTGLIECVLFYGPVDCGIGLAFGLIALLVQRKLSARTL